MTSNDLAYALVDALDDLILADSDGEDVRVERVQTFDETGLLTSNDGITVTLDDGSKFQLSIVRDDRTL